MSDVTSVIRETDPALANDAVQLGQVKDFGSLAASSQREGRPLMEVEAGTPAQREDARVNFASIAQKIIDRTAKPQLQCQPQTSRRRRRSC